MDQPTKLEMKTSQYDHPDIMSGQHTNGPANLFLREDEGSKWYVARQIRSKHKAKKLIEEHGWLKFVNLYCDGVE